MQVLATDPDPEVRAAAAAHSGCGPADVAQQMCTDPHPAVRSAAAANTACPDGPLKTFGGQANRPDIESRIAAARRGDCPPAMLRALLSDPDAKVRAAAAAHRALPSEAVTAAARDKDNAVRVAVAERSDCPPLLLAEMAADPYASRLLNVAIAANTNCPSAVIDDLVLHATHDKIRAGGGDQP